MADIKEIESVIEKAIKDNCEDCAEHNGTNRLEVNCDEQSCPHNIIIEALQEKLEREKGCEYCDNEASEYACDSDGMMRICKGNEHCLPYIAVDNDTYGTSDLFDISYCPMCGRDLRQSK